MLRNLFCVVVAVVWTSVCFFLAVGALLFGQAWSMKVVRSIWSPVLLWAGGAKLEVLGIENVPAGQPVIFVTNHQSTIDIPTIFMALPADVRFVAKKALQWVPLMGWYMTLAHFVFVDRANHKQAVASLDKAGQRIRGGISIVMFPEGTRSEDLKVLPFKKGPFALAMKAGVPIIPITIEGSGKLMPKNKWTITPGPIRVQVGKPIDPAPFGDDRAALTRAVRDVVIDQSVALGGLGGDRQVAVAARGLEGIGQAQADAEAQRQPQGSA
jgi:1-acyl-sn-glycerol-3-phosphate acyltransferase